MRYSLIVLLLILGPVVLFAQTNKIKTTLPQKNKPRIASVRKSYYETQKHHLFVDAATPLSSGCPGFSLTYCYKTTKHNLIGLGIQGYNIDPTFNNALQFTPAVFADFRLVFRPYKKNQFFIFTDLGINFYKHNNNYYSAPYNHILKDVGDKGFYMGLGFTYFRRMTKKGGGPYVMLKMISNWHSVQEYHPATGQLDQKSLSFDAVPTLSLGFKF
jgi:hypothetical protein